MQPNQQQPSKRQLPFTSSKPPLGDYHRLSTDPLQPSSQEPEGIVVKSTPLKRKSETANYEQGVGAQVAGSGSFNGSSPMQTPISGKAGNSQKAPRTSKARSAAQATSSLGSPSGNNVTPVGPCRYDNSLGLLTKKFINLLKHAKDGILDLNKAADTLEVQKRRIYDITNVLEGIGLIEKKLKNMIQWKGLDVLRPGEVDESVTSLQAGVENLAIEESRLDEQIRKMEERLRDLSGDENNKRWLFVTEDDIKSLPCLQNDTLIAIKAPHGTSLEVPDPDEAVDYPQRRYRIVFRSTMGPIDVYLVSKFEEKFEEINTVEEPSTMPPTSGFIENETVTLPVDDGGGVGVGMEEQENQRECPDAGTSQDFVSGIVKIVPDVDNEADYWLLSDADVSITDMWTESALDWNALDSINEDYSIADVSTPRAQTPPSSLVFRVMLELGVQNDKFSISKSVLIYTLYSPLNDLNPLKRKSETTNYKQGVGAQIAGSGNADVSSPMQTLISVKAGKSQKAPKTSNARSVAQATSSSGSPSGDNVTPVGPCRYDNSLGSLTKKFINLIKHAEDGVLDLNKAADTLEVEKRRLYDVTNVLEGVGLLEKKSLNMIQWKGLNVSRPGEVDESVTSLQAEVENLTIEGSKLDKQIREKQERLRVLSEDENNERYHILWLNDEPSCLLLMDLSAHFSFVFLTTDLFFVTEDDIKSLPCLQNDTLIAIRFPHGTSLEIPDPNEAVDYPQRRSSIVIRSTMGPIDVYLISKFEEKFEQIITVEEPSIMPSTSGFIEKETAALPVDVLMMAEELVSGWSNKENQW
ncbi:hypothetical protein KY290_029125 [Solanum tuberosum]|uniref:E2F/DP family winged-helix DNA-binding domain-containing protein n=1 Tax=Solanum tuberosum TaxID=4113 RepID=A0ABQ7UL60_SOLTU|nr:hypothetical protein KY290_029125 [Solanum tuberosum]